MRKILSLILVTITITLSAQQPSKPATPQPQSLVKLLTATDTVQYSLGAYIGQWLRTNSFSITNRTVFQRGMDDVLQNRKLAIPDSIVSPLVSSYQLTIQNARAKALEDQLFASLRGKQGVGVMPNGVHYIVIKNGTGPRPSAKDSVVFNTIGVFPDGNVFEDTYKKKRAIATITGSLIPGLAEAMQIMPEGSVWRIFIPSMLGYGPSGLPNVIPPNSALVFDVALDKVIKR